MMKLFGVLFGGVLGVVFVIALNLGLLALAVWVVIKVLQCTGVIGGN